MKLLPYLFKNVSFINNALDCLCEKEFINCLALSVLKMPKREPSPISKRGIPRGLNTSSEDDEVEEKALLVSDRCHIYSTDRATNLKVHMDRCGSIMMYRVCGKCPYQSTHGQLHYLKVHMKKAHGDKWESYRVAMYNVGEYL